MITSITSKAITEGQARQYTRLVEDAARCGADLALEKVSMDQEGMQRLLGRGGDLKSAVVAEIVAATHRLGGKATPVRRAREVMKENFLGFDDVARYYGATFTKESRRALGLVPFPEATLKECRHTHLLVVGYPMTILGIQARALGSVFDPGSRWDDWRGAAAEMVDLRWYLIRKTGVHGGRTFVEQVALLGAQECVPRACEVVYAWALYCLAKGKRLWGQEHYVRCADFAQEVRTSNDSTSSCVMVGGPGAHLELSASFVSTCLDCIGVAAARKSE